MDTYADFSQFYDLYVGERLGDLPFYLEYAKRATGAILEVGAGSGRLTIPFAREGVEVTALDSSSSMLAKLRARLEAESKEVQNRVDVVCLDAQNMELEREYELIIVPFYTFNYFLTDTAQAAVLQRLGGHLSQTGLLLLDVFVPHERIANCPSEPVPRVDAVDPQTGYKVRGWNLYSINKDRQIETRRMTFEITSASGEISKKEFIIDRRYFFKAELEQLFSDHGFGIEAVFAGYDKQAATGDSGQLMFVLTRS